MEDAARAAILCMQSGADLDVVNAGSGEEIAIADLARRIAALVGYEGELRFDRSAPDGAPRKLFDSSRLRALGWEPRVLLDEGLPRTYEWYTAFCAGAGS